ncbi:MAG TPA: hypothetical protein VMY42_28555 [Thermoguttaceae bacterium]|nr:hypothetical protein [Thermoguttaceae bacterium]
MNLSARVLFTPLFLLACAVPGVAQVWRPASACMTCENGQRYQLVYQTVYDRQEVTAYRMDYETVYDQQQVTSYRPVWETEVRTCRYRVCRPVAETTVRKEYCTVMKPVWETQQREERYTVRRPVYETSTRTEYQTVMEPVTTYRTVYVDQGCYQDYTVLRPGLPQTRLRWVPGNCTLDPLTGLTVYQRPGLYWEQTPGGRYEVQRVWKPNLVTQQVPQTTYCAKVIANEVPVQTCRYEQVEMTRTIPYKVCRMVEQQYVREIPVTTYRMAWEEREQDVSYRVCRMQPFQETVRVARCVEKRIPVTYTCSVPRVVCCRIPLDPCGQPLATFSDAVPQETQKTPVPQEPTRAVPPEKAGDAAADVVPELDGAIPGPVDDVLPPLPGRTPYDGLPAELPEIPSPTNTPDT